MVASVEQERDVVYGQLKEYALSKFGEKIDNMNLLIREGRLGGVTWEHMRQVFLLIALDEVREPVAPNDIEKLKGRVVTARNFLRPGGIESSRRVEFMEHLLREMFCTQTLCKDVHFELNPSEWEGIDAVIDALAQDDDWFRFAFLVAMRFILHPDHIRPTEEQMAKIHARARNAFTAFSNYGVFLFCVRLLEPEKFPKVEESAWMESFGHTGATEESIQDFAFLFFAASDLRVEGTALRATRRSVPVSQAESLPITRNI